MGSNDESLPQGWEARTSRSTGQTYYVNKCSKKSQWEKPGSNNDGNDSDCYNSDGYSPHEVQCSHILVKHNSSRRPSSWREEVITRSKREAFDIIEEYRRKIVNKEEKFDELALNYSDCSSAKRRGNLGHFKKGKMQKAFELVAFSLKIGQMSQPVETDSGWHLILRTA